jgi:serine protease Do
VGRSAIRILEAKLPSGCSAARRLSLFGVFLTLGLAACAPRIGGGNERNRPAVDPKAVALDGPSLALVAKPSVVRVIDAYFARFDLSGGSEHVVVGEQGSGTIVSSVGHVVTNAHVVTVSRDLGRGGERALERKASRALFERFRKAGWRFDSSVDVESIEPAASKHIHLIILPDGSRFEFRLVLAGTSLLEGGKDVAVLAVDDARIRNVPMLKVGEFGDVQSAQHVTVVGYPALADVAELENVEGPYDKSFLDSSITDGRISATEKSVGGTPVLQYSAPTTHGNSGGPVLNDQGEIVGLATLGASNASGINFAVPSTTITEFLKATGVDNTLGAGDLLYREGLALYGQVRYAEAREAFDRARTHSAHHSEVDRLIQSCERKAPVSSRRASTAGLDTARASPDLPGDGSVPAPDAGGGSRLAVAALAILCLAGFAVVLAVAISRK